MSNGMWQKCDVVKIIFVILSKLACWLSKVDHGYDFKSHRQKWLAPNYPPSLSPSGPLHTPQHNISQHYWPRVTGSQYHYYHQYQLRPSLPMALQKNCCFADKVNHIFADNWWIRVKMWNKGLFLGTNTVSSHSKKNYSSVNTLKLRHNERQIPDEKFQLYFLEWKYINFD